VTRLAPCVLAGWVAENGPGTSKLSTPDRPAGGFVAGRGWIGGDVRTGADRL